VSKTRWYNERLNDFYFKEAKKEGYRARSAYKLKQLDKKYNIIRKGSSVVDLGSAPGGWSQVLVELIGEDGLVVGVDLRRVVPIHGSIQIQGDFTRRDTHDRLHETLKENGKETIDCIISDMAPDMSGNYDLDQTRSVHLAGMALRFAVGHLRPGGHFCCKVFEGADFHEFREELRTHFSRVFQFHPEASRKASSEIYLVGRGFKPAYVADEEE
jgi:23S rRNA (uridine2552-2'-O)-methyltransferase